MGNGCQTCGTSYPEENCFSAHSTSEPHHQESVQTPLARTARLPLTADVSHLSQLSPVLLTIQPQIKGSHHVLLKLDNSLERLTDRRETLYLLLLDAAQEAGHRARYGDGTWCGASITCPPHPVYHPPSTLMEGLKVTSVEALQIPLGFHGGSTM